MSYLLKIISIYPLKLLFDQLQQTFFSFTHSVLTKHIIIKIVSLSLPEIEMGIKLKIFFKTRDGNRTEKNVYARLFVPTVHCVCHGQKHDCCKIFAPEVKKEGRGL